VSKLTNTGHAGKEIKENKFGFKLQKTGKVVADVMSVGGLFHKRLHIVNVN